MNVAANSIGLFKMGATCNAAPVLVGVVGAGSPVTIPARGHYLFVGSGYGLADYGGSAGSNAAGGDTPLTSDLESDASVAIFSTTDVSLLSTSNRLDAVGFGTNDTGLCALLVEGATLPAAAGSQVEHSYFRKECDFVPGVPCVVDGNPKDTNDNAADFLLASVGGVAVAGVERLGAPGPQNSTSPVRLDNKGISAALLDSSQGAAGSVNRKRDANPGGANYSQFGTLSIRRRVINNTAGPVTRLRFRIVELTTYPNDPGNADLRALSSSDVANVSITNDSGTCGGSPSCTVTVKGTSLEQPPNQDPSAGGVGGGYNTTYTVALPGGTLAKDASVNVQFMLGVQQPGKFRFYIIIEALPGVK